MMIFAKNKKILAATVLLTLFRIWIGLKAEISYNVQAVHDEALLVSYSILPSHFADTANPFALAKDMSFSIFLNIVHFSGLPYSLVITLVWICAAVLSVMLVRIIVKNPSPIFCIVIYAFVLFVPCAFDNLVGTKFYRNAIIAPFALLLFLLLILLVLKSLQNRGKAPSRRFVLAAVCVGLLLGFNYYITENGVWIIPAAAVCLGVAVATLWLTKNRAYAARTTIILIIPLLVLVGAGTAYRAVNYHYFGVFEVNMRTGGEPGKFAENIYKIDSKERTSAVWAPTDAIEKAFEVSATLKKSPELRKKLIEENPWFGDIRQAPIRGDFLTWSLPDAMKAAGMWKSYPQVNAYFAQVNRELDAAFADGRLKKDPKFQPFSSTGGYSKEEILALMPTVWQGMKNDIAYDAYQPSDLLGNLQNIPSFEIGVPGIKGDYMANMFLEQGPYAGYYESERHLTDKLMSGDIRLYQILGWPLFALGVIGFVLLFLSTVRKKTRCAQNVNLFICDLMMLATAAAVFFGIAWFSDFLYPQYEIASTMKYYSVAAVPCLVIFEIIGLCVIYMAVRNTAFFRKISPNQLLS